MMPEPGTLGGDAMAAAYLALVIVFVVAVAIATKPGGRR